MTQRVTLGHKCGSSLQAPQYSGKGRLDIGSFGNVNIVKPQCCTAERNIQKETYCLCSLKGGTCGTDWSLLLFQMEMSGRPQKADVAFNVNKKASLV